MKIPAKFAMAFMEKCPSGIWSFNMYVVETEELIRCDYDMEGTWALICELAETQRHRAVEVLERFGFHEPAPKPKERHLKIV